MYVRQYDEAPSMAVVSAVSEATNQSALEVEPLWEAVDPDALDRAFDTGRTEEAQLSVRFEYCGCRVTVDSNSIRVERSD